MHEAPFHRDRGDGGVLGRRPQLAPRPVEALPAQPVDRAEAHALGEGETPLVFGTSEEGKLFKFTVGDDFKLTKAGEAGLAGFAMQLAVVE